MELPIRARTADWENGVLALDREKQFEVPKLTAEIMERLAGYTLVGFHVKGYPVTDELLTPFAGHKSMANFGVEDGALTDACFPVFSAMPKLRYLLLDGNIGINGSGLSALQSCKLDLLALNRTGLDDAVCSRRPPSPGSPTSRSTTPPLPTRACWPSPRTADRAGGPCAIHPRADGALLPASAGEGEKARPAGRAGGGGMPQGVVRFLCRDDGMGAVYGAGRV